MLTHFVFVIYCTLVTVGVHVMDYIALATTNSVRTKRVCLCSVCCNCVMTVCWCQHSFIIKNHGSRCAIVH